MSAKLYTDSQLLDFYREYLALAKSLPVFANDRNLSIWGLRHGFDRLNLPLLSQKIVQRKHPIKEDFFQCIDDENKAYYLGFLYADGCNGRDAHRVELSIAKRDKEVIERLSMLLYDQIHMKEYRSKRSGVQDRVAIYIINEKISSDLEKLGCGPRKTFQLKFPAIPYQLRQHFIRGYFDGDGSLTIGYRRQSKNTDTRTIEAYFSIVSTKEMLDAIGDIVADLGVKYEILKRHKQRDNNNFTLRVHGNRQINTVCDFLYAGATVFLSRKFNNYRILCDRRKR